MESDTVIRLSELTNEFYKPGEAAKMLNINVRTVQRYCEEGMMEFRLTETGRRMIYRDSLIRTLEAHQLLIDDSADTRKDAVYARVSTHKQKARGDLDRQIEKICAFAATKNPRDLVIYSDTASGLNDNRKGLNALMDEVLKGNINRIFINYKDRLTRFGFNYLKRMCTYNKTEIIIVSSEEDSKTMEEELAQDIVSIIHSFSGKLYRMRRAVKKKIDEELSENGKEEEHAEDEPKKQIETDKDNHADRKASVQARRS